MCVLGGISNRSAGGVLFVRSKNKMIYSNFWPTHLPHLFLLNYRFVKDCDKQNVILTCTLALFCDLVIYNFESRGAAAKIEKKILIFELRSTSWKMRNTAVNSGLEGTQVKKTPAYIIYIFKFPVELHSQKFTVNCDVVDESCP